MTGIRSNGPKDFPRIAKEMGFNFSLRRGRVDWHRIGSIDIDRLVQDRDLISLQENLISCTYCGKKFLAASFLEAHHGRRHPDMPFSMPADTLRSETERLQLEIKELKERLNSAERLIHKESEQQSEVPVTVKQRGDEQRKWTEEQKKKLESWQEAQQRKYQDEISELKSVFYNEIKRMKEGRLAENSSSPSKAELTEVIHKQNEELASLREIVSRQSTPDLENVQGRLEAQERFWKSRLKQIETQHMNEMQELKIQLSLAGETQNKNHDLEYENKIHELLAHAARQDEYLKTQAEQILQLTESLAKQTLHPEISELQAKLNFEKSESIAEQDIQETTLDPDATFAKLAARIDNAIQASKKLPQRSNSMKEKITDITNQKTAETPHSSLKKVSSFIESSRKFNLPKKIKTASEKTSLVPIKSSVNTKKSALEEESSSESSPTVENIEISSMYGSVDKTSVEKQRSPNKAWSIKKPSSSLEGSKDSGLDSPKRLKTAVTKITAFHKPTSVISVSEDRVGSVADSESHDEEEVEEEEEDEEEEEEVEEEETISGEEEEESEMETESGSEPAVQPVDRLDNSMKKKGLREDMQELLARRLRELGVDPEWKGIPGGTFKQKMGILKHHQNITRYKSFFRIKKKIVEELEKRVAESENITKKTNTENEDDKKANSSENKMAMKKFVGKMKTKALSVLKRQTSKDKAGATGKLKKTACTLVEQSATSIHMSDIRSTTRTGTSPTKPTGISTHNIPIDRSKKNRTDAVKASIKPTISRSAAGKPKVTVVTSTPKKITEIPAASPRGSILKGQRPGSISRQMPGVKKKEVENPPISTEEEDEEEEEEEESEEEEQTEIKMPAAANIRQTTTQPLPVKQLNFPRPASASSIITLRNQEFSSDQESPRGSKSALKSSSSMGSITKKKKVLFADQDLDSNTDSEDNIQTQLTKTLPKPWNIAKVTTVSRFSKSSETIPIKPSIQSSLSSPSQNIKPTAQSSSKVSDSDSDWGLSSVQDNIEEVLKETEDIHSVSESGSYERINLSTKQSEKIAQISKNIEEQLRMARSKPPTGGVEAMFRDKQSTSSNRNQENNMNVANSSASNPKTQAQPSTSKLTLSDWDLEDFDD
ncbi:hypothetical protein L9F63_002011 [Diploptera punctata]|uniref:C2H2-type domain-containing protein n=1 Tax=Diploptera punctata TaxID=6984 RepID=A0AAD8A3E9_DIPPU|nr:hypothetical protein L9F63_002011 [Diploptera punctata]